MAEFDIPPSNIDLMQDTILRGGIAFPNRYSVSVMLPPALSNPNSTEQKQLNIRCENAAIVGRAFSTLQYRFYGPARNIPYESIYSGEIQISFLLSGYLQEREYFETWMNKMCNKDDYKFRYYDEYVGSMVVTVIGRDEVPTYSILLEEVCPKLIGEISLGYDKNDEAMRQDITLSYRKYSINKIELPAPPPYTPPPPQDWKAPGPQPYEAPKIYPPESPQDFQIGQGSRSIIG